MITELLHEHRVLRDLVQRLLASVAQDTLAHPVELAELRKQLMLVVAEHVRHEDALYREAAARQTAPVAHLSLQLERWLEAFAAHGHRWPHAELAADWAGYVAAERDLLERLLAHLLLEERFLYPQLDLVPA